jgi:hypothetical protein
MPTVSFAVWTMSLAVKVRDVLGNYKGGYGLEYHCGTVSGFYGYSDVLHKLKKIIQEPAGESAVMSRGTGKVYVAGDAAGY